MKVCFMFSRWDDKGGISSVLENLFSTSFINNNEVTVVIADNDSQWLSNYQNKVNIIRRKYRSSNKTLDEILRFIFFSRVLITGSYDAVIEYVMRPLHLDKLIQRLFSKSYSVISWPHMSLDKWGGKTDYLVNYADYSLAISSGIQQQILELGVPKEKISLIYNPIQTANIIQRSQKCTVKFAYIGRLNEKQKNLSEMVKGFSQLNYHDYELHFFGDGINRSNEPWNPSSFIKLSGTN